MNDTTTPSVPVPDEDEISLLDLATALGEEKTTLFAIPFITTLVAVVVSLQMTPIFTAKTVVMPPQQQQSGAAAALASLGSSFSMKASIAFSDSASLFALLRSHLPASTAASGSSMPMGWPIHSIMPSLPTMNAQGMPFWPAAFSQLVATSPSKSVATG